MQLEIIKIMILCLPPLMVKLEEIKFDDGFMIRCQVTPVTFYSVY